MQVCFWTAPLRRSGECGCIISVGSYTTAYNKKQSEKKQSEIDELNEKTYNGSVFLFVAKFRSFPPSPPSLPPLPSLNILCVMRDVI